MSTKSHDTKPEQWSATERHALLRHHAKGATVAWLAGYLMRSPADVLAKLIEEKQVRIFS